MELTRGRLAEEQVAVNVAPELLAEVKIEAVETEGGTEAKERTELEAGRAAERGRMNPDPEKMLEVGTGG